MIAELSNALLEEAGLPFPYWDSGENQWYGDKAALDQVHSYAVKHHRRAFRHGTGLLIRGEMRSGKTFLLCFALKCLMLRHYNVQFVTLKQVKEWTLQHDDGEFNAKLIDPDFLGIDAVDEDSNGARIALAEVTRTRGSLNKPILITTAFPRETRQMNDAQVVDCFSEAYRNTATWLKKVNITIWCELDKFESAKQNARRKKSIL